VPMLTAICADSRVLAISYLDINDARINSFVNFAYIDRVFTSAQALEDGHMDNIFAAHRDNPDQIIGAMSFMDNGHLVAMSDTRIYGIDPASGTAWEMPLNNMINRHYFGSDWFVVAYGENLLNRVGYAAGTVAAYDAMGRRLFEFAAAGIIDSLVISGNNVVVGVDGHFTALSRNGQVLWQHTQPGSVDLAAIGGTDRIAAAAQAQTLVLHRVRR